MPRAQKAPPPPPPGLIVLNFSIKFPLKTCLVVEYVTIFQPEKFSYIIKSVRKLFRRNWQKESENISAEVFPPKFYPPKFLGVNVY